MTQFLFCVIIFDSKAISKEKRRVSYLTQVMEEQNPLGTERIGKLIPKFAIPSIISMVVSSLYNIVDQIFIGQGVGYLGNAATTVAFPRRILHFR